jgi:hypothetical protein
MDQHGQHRFLVEAKAAGGVMGFAAQEFYLLRTDDRYQTRIA